MPKHRTRDRMEIRMVYLLCIACDFHILSHTHIHYRLPAVTNISDVSDYALYQLYSPPLPHSLPIADTHTPNNVNPFHMSSPFGSVFDNLTVCGLSMNASFTVNEGWDRDREKEKENEREKEDVSSRLSIISLRGREFNQIPIRIALFDGIAFDKDAPKIAGNYQWFNKTSKRNWKNTPSWLTIRKKINPYDIVWMQTRKTTR